MQHLKDKLYNSITRDMSFAYKGIISCDIRDFLNTTIINIIPYVVT